MILKCFAALQCSIVPHHPTVRLVHPKIITPTPSSSTITRRGALSTALISTTFTLILTLTPPSKSAIAEFSELPNSGGVKALELRLGDGEVPADGDQVAVHYYGRLAAKQGWRFDSTYDHKDENGEPIPFVFVIGSGKLILPKILVHGYIACHWQHAYLASRHEVISGIETAVKSMKVGGVRRVVIPPSQGYQNTSQEPVPPNFFDRQRLFTTIFNPTRLANGEGSTLGTLVFDIELVSLRHK